MQQVHEKDYGKQGKERIEMMDVGRLCIKIAGRNAGSYCVIVDKVDDNFVLIDGNVKRKKCNIRHLEPLDKVMDIRKGASTSAVHEAMKKENIDIVTVKSKVKKAEKPVRQRKKKVAEPAKEKPKKK